MKTDEALRIAVEALEFYANRGHWGGFEEEDGLLWGNALLGDGVVNDYDPEPGSTCYTAGRTAREALAAIKLAEERAQEAPKTERKSTDEIGKEIVNKRIQTALDAECAQEVPRTETTEVAKNMATQIANNWSDFLRHKRDEFIEIESHNIQTFLNAQEARKHETGSEVRPVVAWFAQQMEKKLRANDHKPGWREDAPRLLLNRLREELKELEEDVSVLEAVDVANFAMMIADNVDPHRFKRHQAELQPPTPGPSPAGGEDRCVTCGSRVRVVGHTTKHYEPIEACGEFPSETEFLLAMMKAALDYKSSGPLDYNAGCSEAYRWLKSRLQAPGPAQPRSGE